MIFVSLYSLLIYSRYQSNNNNNNNNEEEKKAFTVSPLHMNEFHCQERIRKSNLFMSPTKLA